MTRYMTNVVGCIEPELLGPFKTEAARTRKAREVEAENSQTDALFWADVKGGKLEVGSCSAGFFERRRDGQTV